MNERDKGIRESSAVERLIKQEPVEFSYKQSPSVGEKSSDDLLFNFALVFRMSIRTFQRIRRFLLDSDAALIYQTTSTEKLVIQRASRRMCVDCIAWSGRCGRGLLNRVANSDACTSFIERQPDYERVREDND